jgi:hypothetical protein
MMMVMMMETVQESRGKGTSAVRNHCWAMAMKI